MGGLLEVRGLTVELRTLAGWVRPVNEVFLRINKGESGSGKTLLSLAVMGLSAAERAPLLHLSLSCAGLSIFDCQLLFGRARIPPAEIFPCART